MPTKEKENKIKLIKDKIADSNCIIVTDHTGVNVNDITILRRELKKTNAELRVAKNTLMSLAVKETELEKLTDIFVGPSSLVFGFDDPSVPARIIYDFGKKTDKPKVKAFVLENRLLSVEDYKKIAQLPPKEQVLAMVVGAVQGPITGFVMTLDGVIRNFIGLVDALAEKKS